MSVPFSHGLVINGFRRPPLLAEKVRMEEDINSNKNMIQALVVAARNAPSCEGSTPPTISLPMIHPHHHHLKTFHPNSSAYPTQNTNTPPTFPNLLLFVSSSQLCQSVGIRFYFFVFIFHMFRFSVDGEGVCTIGKVGIF